MMEKLRLMSTNLWWCDGNHEAWAAIGADCSNAKRAPEIARFYEEWMPDVIGLQECSGRMAHVLMACMTERQLPYTFLWGRDTPIMYRRDKFELVDGDVCIYPEEVPGLEGSFNNLKTKAYALAVLRSKASGKCLIFATTHLWYKSDKSQPGSEVARGWQMDRLIDRLDALQAQYGCGAVVVGDFNTWPAGKAVQTALSRGFVHGHDVATEHADDTTGMHFCCDAGFDGHIKEGGFAHSIDHIMLRGVQGAVRRFERVLPDYYVPVSDHSPLWVDVEWEK